MDRLNRIIKYQLKDSTKSIGSMWLILLLINLAVYLFNTFNDTFLNIGISHTDHQGITYISIFGMNTLIILVSLIVTNYEKYYTTFALAINSSVRRKDFFVSKFIDNIFVVGLMAIIQGTLFKIEPIFIRAIGRLPLYDLQLFNTQDDSLIYIIFSLFITFFIFTNLWNMIAVLNYKFTAKLWIAILVLVLISGNLPKIGFFDLILPGDWLNARLDLQQLFGLFILLVIFNIIIYFTTINTNARDRV